MKTETGLRRRRGSPVGQEKASSQAKYSKSNLTTLIDSLPHWYDAGYFRAIGEVATQYAGIPPSDPDLEPLFAFAEREGIPVGIHMGVGPPGAVHDFAPEFRMRYGDPLELEDVLARHPSLKLYVMHAGYPRLDEMVALLDQYPQVYGDLSVINWVEPRPAFHRYLRRLVEAGYADRLMFGSDQMIWPEAIERGIEAIETADFLSEEQKRGIFHDNAARLFGLDREDGSPEAEENRSAGQGGSRQKVSAAQENNPFKGAWVLEAFHGPAGEVSEDRRPALVLFTDTHFSFLIAVPSPPERETPSGEESTNAEMAEASASIEGGSGRYETGGDSIVISRAYVHTDPNAMSAWPERVRRYRVRIEGDKLYWEWYGDSVAVFRRVEGTPPPY